MKKLNFGILGFLALSACASPVKYTTSDSTKDGVHIALGSKDGLAEGETVRVLEKSCKSNGKTKGCTFKTIGHLRIMKVEGKKSSLAQQDANIKLDENTYFDKEPSAENENTRPEKFIK